MKEKGGSWFKKLVKGVACALPTRQFCPVDRLPKPNPLAIKGKVPQGDGSVPNIMEKFTAMIHQ